MRARSPQAGVHGAVACELLPADGVGHGCRVAVPGVRSLQAQPQVLAMKHSHVLCAVFGALTILLLVRGAGAWALLPAAGCPATCAHMVWTMIRGGHEPTPHA